MNRVDQQETDPTFMAHAIATSTIVDFGSLFTVEASFTVVNLDG